MRSTVAEPGVDVNLVRLLTEPGLIDETSIMGFSIGDQIFCLTTMVGHFCFWRFCQIQTFYANRLSKQNFITIFKRQLKKPEMTCSNKNHLRFLDRLPLYGIKRDQITKIYIFS